MNDTEYEKEIAALSAELETVKGERDEAILSGWKAAIDCVSYTAANTYGPRVDAKAVSAARDELVQELLTSSPGEYLDVQWKNAQDAVAAEAKLAGGEAVKVKPLEWSRAPDGAYGVVAEARGEADKEFEHLAIAERMRRAERGLTHSAPTHNDGSGEVTEAMIDAAEVAYAKTMRGEVAERTHLNALRAALEAALRGDAS